jgi:glutamyl/glutaminyl-tRNA synthetase
MSRPRCVGCSTSSGLKPKTAFTPVRVALTGRTVAPGLFESAALLGREETLGRLRAARARLDDQRVPNTPVRS